MGGTKKPLCSMRIWRKLYHPHSAIITVMIILFILLFRFLFLNMHFLDPFNNGLRDYEISDIVYSKLRDPNQVEPVPEVVLINTGLLDRTTLTRILQHLKRAAPKAIGIDIELDGRKDALSDALLREAIAALPQLVLAGRLKYYDPKTKLFDPLQNCDPYFSQKATMGYTNFVSEDTRTIRFFAPSAKTKSGTLRAFAVEIAEKYKPGIAKRLLKRRKPIETIYYTGNQSSFVKLEATQIVDSTTFASILDQGILKNKIIILGYIGNHEPGEPELDRFFTPLNSRYSGKTYPDMHEAVIHANIVAMILNGKYVFDFPKWLITVFGWIF